MGLLDRIGAFDRYKVSPTQGTSGLLTGAQQPMSPFAQQAARQIGGALGMDMRTPNEKLTQELAQVDPQDPNAESMQLAALVKFGTPTQQLQATQRLKQIESERQEKLVREAEKQQVSRFRQSLIGRSNALGGTEERANSILEAPPSLLGEIRKEILAEEQAAAVKNAGVDGRYAVGQLAGLTREQIKGYSNLTDDQFGEVMSGLEADDVAYKDTGTGNVGVYRVNKYSMVATENPNGTTKWVDPNTLNLVPAVKETKDVGRANELTTQLAKEGVSNFTDVTNNARDAYRALKVNQDRLSVLDSIDPTLLGSKLSQLTIDAQLLLANSLGIETEGVESAEQAQLLIAQGVEAVGQSIKAFGAGTGLSDADRTFAQIGAGATAELTAANIRQLIEAANMKAQEQIALHDSIYKKLEKGGASASSLAFYMAAPDLPADLSKYYSTP